MKPLLLLPLALLAACSATPSDAPVDPALQLAVQDEGDGGGMMEMSPEEMAAMVAFMMPSDAHASLATMTGDWDVNAKMWEPGSENPMTMTYTTSAEMILGGRYLVEEATGSFMGQDFEGMLLMGYNNGTQEYFSLWIDNFGTGMSLSKGKAERDGTVPMMGTMEDWVAPAGRPLRSVMEVGDDEHTLHMWSIHEDGTEVKAMELHYTRQMADVEDSGEVVK